MSKSQEWLRSHLSTIGGSNAGAAAGRGRFKTRRELVAQMIEARAGEYIKPHAETDDMRRGTMMEPLALELLNQYWPNVMFYAHPQQSFIENDAFPWAHYLPDAVRGDRCSYVEIKVPRPQTVARVRRHGLYPEWIDQAQHGMAVADTVYCVLVIMDPVACTVDVHEIRRDQEYIDELMRAEEETWGYVLRGELPPEVDNVEPAEPGTVLIADPRVAQLASHFADMQQLSDEAAELLEDAKAGLLAAVGCTLEGKAWSGGPEEFEVPGVLRATHRNQAGQHRFNTAKAQQDFPVLANDEYVTTTKASRPLRVRLLGADK